MHTISSKLIEAYRTALYHVTGIEPCFTLRIGRHSPELATLYRKAGKASAAFVTAWNPYSAALSDAANYARQKRLIAHLEELGIPVYQGESSDPAGEHREESVLALGIELATATMFMRRFEQNGIVFCGGDAVPQLILRAAGSKGEASMDESLKHEKP